MSGLAFKVITSHLKCIVIMRLHPFTIFLTYCSTKGAFTPSGYFLKAVFLHSGQAVSRYSDPLYDAEPTRIASFELLSQPVDVFQGEGGPM